MQAAMHIQAVHVPFRLVCSCEGGRWNPLVQCYNMFNTTSCTIVQGFCHLKHRAQVPLGLEQAWMAPAGSHMHLLYTRFLYIQGSTCKGCFQWCHMPMHCPAPWPSDDYRPAAV